MLKKLAKILSGLVLLFIVVGVILLLAVNTERNKSAIQAAVLSSTGYELIIAGDMDINFFPSIGLTLNDIRLKNPASPQELASTSAALLQVDLRALIAGEIMIRELSTDGFHINYYIDSTGKSNWDTSSAINNEVSVADISPPSSAQANAQTGSMQNGQENNGDIVTVSFERLQIDNASIDIQDLSQGVRYSVNKLNLVSTDTNIQGRPFNVDVSFDFLNNGMTKPMAMEFKSDVAADINAGNISVENISLTLTPMLLQGDLKISGFNEAISYQGMFKSNSFDIRGLMQTLGLSAIEENFIETNSILTTAQAPQLTYEFNFNGDEFGIEIPEFLMQIANTEVEAEAKVRFATDFSPTNISYGIVSNQIDLSPFITKANAKNPPIGDVSYELEELEPSAGTDSVPGNSVVGDTNIPSEILSSFNLLGSISVESVVANGMEFNDINVFTNVEDGVLDIEIQPVSAFSGTIQGNIRLDGRTPEAALNTQFSISQLNIVELAPSLSRLDSVTGNLDVEIDYTATASSSNAIRDTLSGSTAFAVTENSVDIGVIKQIFTAISALSPSGGNIEQWPSVIRFAELSGFILLENGLAENQQLKLRMDNFDVSGSGGISFSQQNFDYDLLFTVLGEPYLQTIPVDDLYHDVSWPVECSAAFADELSQYCRPDFTQVREIFTQIGTNAVRSRLNEVITDQLPPEVRDGARGLLRNLFN